MYISSKFECAKKQMQIFQTSLSSLFFSLLCLSSNDGVQMNTIQMESLLIRWFIRSPYTSIIVIIQCISGHMSVLTTCFIVLFPLEGNNNSDHRCCCCCCCFWFFFLFWLFLFFFCWLCCFCGEKNMPANDLKKCVKWVRTTSVFSSNNKHV